MQGQPFQPYPVREAAPVRASSVLSPSSAQPPRNDAPVPASIGRAQARGSSVSRGPAADQSGAGEQMGAMANCSSQRAIASDAATGPGGSTGFPPSPEARVRTPSAAWKGQGGAPVIQGQAQPRPSQGSSSSAYGQQQAAEAGPYSSARGPRTSAVHSDPRLSQGHAAGPPSSAGASSTGGAEGSGDASKVVRQLSVPWEHQMAQQGVMGGMRLAQGQTGANGYPGLMEGGRPPPPVVTYSARGAGSQTAAAMYGGRVPYVFSANAQEAPHSGRSPGRHRPGAVQVVSNGRSPARTRPSGAGYLGPSGSTCALNPSPELLSARQEGGGTPAELSKAAPGTPGVSNATPSVADAVNAPAQESTALPVETPVVIPEAPPRPSTGQATNDATLLSVWPGLGDDDSDLCGLPGQSGSTSALHPQDIEASPERARGQLTAEEKLAYSDLEFVEHLGSGEFGQVFRGTTKGQEVAIKQLYWDNTVLPQVIIQDLTREIESFRHLRHKRLVSFVGACLEVPNLCIVTEYAPGGSLHHLLHVRKLRLPLLHCTNMCLQLAEGVTYLHSQNPVVVHRDLKSLNVVLDLSLNLKLCDFGLTESMDRTHITKKNNGGSPRYMAPELFDNKSKITEKVDIWSMGCIFTEINGGPLPYEGINTLAELTREMLVNRRTPSIPPTIAEPLQVVVRSCYNFDGRFRPAARQVYDQLRDAKKRLRAAGLLGGE
eukprot:TRINITY_DN1641_c0_g1_i1.p1 TRINITY_DN1641_c0_g1~~TRINITY_DN1641_c0_g1_i1.p1  ORF type:complete len:772 (+),score=106.15 TRINITY_DN1641_c0_g1_i1:171-2318(+)